MPSPHHSILNSASFDLDPAAFDGLTREDLSDEVVRKYLAARRWRENHIADRGTYPDPVWREVLAHLGSWQPKRGNA